MASRRSIPAGQRRGDWCYDPAAIGTRPVGSPAHRPETLTTGKSSSAARGARAS